MYKTYVVDITDTNPHTVLKLPKNRRAEIVFIGWANTGSSAANVELSQILADGATEIPLMTIVAGTGQSDYMTSGSAIASLERGAELRAKASAATTLRLTVTVRFRK